MRARACLVLMFGAVKVFALTSANLYEREEIQLKINFVVELEKKAVKADLIRQGELAKPERYFVRQNRR